MVDREKILKSLVLLGQTLTRLPEEIILRATRENPWFSRDGIKEAANAVAGEMLDSKKLREWASLYDRAIEPKNVLLVMAGNIPMAGFFDMLCILVSGHNCIVKYSSKDRVLMEFITRELKRILPEVPIREASEALKPQALIASGSDNAMRHLRAEYPDVPSILRGNRASAAILTGDETTEQISGLASDIFTYSGLGCRNVSHILVPVGYIIKPLSEAISAYPAAAINPKYLNNNRQHRAVLEISGERFVPGKFFLMRESDGFPEAISEVTYGFYHTMKDAVQWVAANHGRIQCVVAAPHWHGILPFDPVPFGAAQSPTLYDFPDRVDTMRLLAAI